MGKKRRVSWASLAFAGCVAAAVGGLAASVLLWADERRSERQRDDEVADEIERAAFEELTKYTTAFAGASSLAMTGGRPDEGAVEVFAQGVIETTGLPAVAYNEVVAETERGAWERRNGFAITELSMNGFTIASARPEYWPVTAVIPLNDNSRAILGFDVRTQRERGDAARASASSGRTVMSAPIVAQPSGEVGIYFAQALLRPDSTAPVGFLTTATQADVLAAHIVEITPASSEFALLDVQTGQRFAWSADRFDVEEEREFSVGGRQVRLETTDGRSARHLGTALAFAGAVVALALAAVTARAARQQRRQAAEMQQLEHRLVSDLQQRIVPSADVSSSEWDIAVGYRAAHAGFGLGGDWYDVIHHEDGAVTLVVGDVAGHGVDAVADMLELRSSLRSLLAAGVSIAGALSVADEIMGESPQLRTATAVILQLDRDNLTWALAGHPPPLLICHDHVVRLDAANGGLLGVSLGRDRFAATLPLPAECAIVVYTDGLIERPRESVDVAIDRLGSDMLSSADTVLADLLEIAFINASGRDDCVCVLARRARRPAPAAGIREGRCGTSDSIRPERPA